MMFNWQDSLAATAQSPDQTHPGRKATAVQMAALGCTAAGVQEPEDMKQQTAADRALSCWDTAVLGASAEAWWAHGGTHKGGGQAQRPLPPLAAASAEDPAAMLRQIALAGTQAAPQKAAA